jgi:pyruvate/2-oxoacid:ferredoxin oxidoreductase beta subunit/Pyruvate/2-oxoacid:ferredoxin oxidoreductase gamma subunit
MHSFLNEQRPPVFCPGCSHDRITHTLDKALQKMGLSGNQITIVSDIGCSGLFDTFFNTHAFHGLHGRALTYATGIKMAAPDTKVIVTMGDGGQGIGGAHLLAASRRNLDLTLLVLNNFNFGMTGGQFSATTPPEARVGSGFLNQIERPLDICQVARSAGAPYVTRCSAYQKDLPEELRQAIEFEGFAVIDIWGVCPGRYSKKNRLTPKLIEAALEKLPLQQGAASENTRQEYGRHYRQLAAAQQPLPPPIEIEAAFQPPQEGRREIVLLGSAGQRIITAGELLCLAGLHAGLHATQKNEYNITVLRGPSISELILSPQQIEFTGIASPSVIAAISQEGVDRRSDLFAHLDSSTIILQINDIRIPVTDARIHFLDLKSLGIKKQDLALAALAAMAKLNLAIHTEMLKAALQVKLGGKALQDSVALVDRVRDAPESG